MNLGCGQSRESELFLNVACVVCSAAESASTLTGLSEQVGPADPQLVGSCPLRTLLLVLLCIIYSFRSFQKDLRVSSSDRPSGSWSASLTSPRPRTASALEPDTKPFIWLPFLSWRG